MYKSLHQYKYNGSIGFKDQYKPEQTVTTGTKILDYSNDTDKIYDFSVFIPPGATSISIIEHCAQSTSTDAQFSFVISKSNQPTSEPKSTLSEVNSLKDTGFKISELTTDCFGKSSNGYIKFIDDETANITEGVWLYVKILKVGDVEVTDISFSILVSLDKYVNWYYKDVKWMTNGDPPSSTSTLEHNTLPSGAYKTLKVTFSPTKAQKYTGDISLETDKGTFTAAISGEGYGSSTDDPGTGGTTTNTTSASVPKASILASEFYNYQDLDDNDLVYGYDFKITDDTSGNKPPDKPIILCILEKSPYWANPDCEISWKDFLDGKEPSCGGTTGTTGTTTTTGTVVEGEVVTYARRGFESIHSQEFGGRVAYTTTKMSFKDRNKPELMGDTEDGMVAYPSFVVAGVYTNNYSIFVPPGTRYLKCRNLMAANPFADTLFVVVGYKRIPSQDYTLDELKTKSVQSSDRLCVYDSIEKDVSRSNDTNSLVACDGVLNRDYVMDKFMELEGGWYNVTHIGDTSALDDLAVIIYIEKDIYKKWYESVKWDSDGNPLSGKSFKISGSTTTTTGGIELPGSITGMFSLHQAALDGVNNYYTNKRGFKNLFNINDSEFQKFIEVKDNKFNVALRLDSNTCKEDFDKISNSFRACIPPGCVSCGISMNTYVATGIITDQEWGYVGWGDAKSATRPTDSNNLPVDGYTVPDIIKSDTICFVSSRAQGVITFSGNSTFTSLTTGGWLIVHFDNLPLGINVNYTFEYDKYKAWYNSAKWGSDGDPIASTGTTTTTGTPFPSGYASYHQIERKINYCSDKVTDDPTGTIICNKSTQLQYYTMMKGFKSLYNINDPKIYCYGQSSCTIKDSDTLVLATSLNNVQLSSNFRVYVPKGAIHAEVSIYGIQQNGEIGTLSRFGVPPTKEEIDSLPKVYDDIPHNFTGFTIPEYSEKAHFVKNRDGIIQVTKIQAFDMLSEGSWLYVSIMSFDGSSSDTYKYSTSFKVGEYKSWYNSAVWDAVGDPLEYK